MEVRSRGQQLGEWQRRRWAWPHRQQGVAVAVALACRRSSVNIVCRVSGASRTGIAMCG